VKKHIQTVIDNARKKARGDVKTSSVTSSFTGSTFTATSSEHIKFKSIEEIRR